MEHARGDHSSVLRSASAHRRTSFSLDLRVHASSQQSVLPTRFGKYELLERIGSGGMAEIFRARLPGLAGFEKIVVIKRLLPHLAGDERVVQMFVEEAKLAAQVQHKNIVQVFEL